MTSKLISWVTHSICDACGAEEQRAGGESSRGNYPSGWSRVRVPLAFLPHLVTTRGGDPNVFPTNEADGDLCNVCSQIVIGDLVGRHDDALAARRGKS